MVIVPAGGEPAIIQHKQLHACLLCLGSNPDQLVLIKIKIGGFPIVNQNRANPVTPCPPGQTAAVQAVKGLAHAVHPLAGINHHRLRCLERLPRLQLPAKALRMNAQHDAGCIEGINLHLCQEIAAVHQRKADCLPLIFIRVRPLQNQERIVGMT